MSVKKETTGEEIVTTLGPQTVFNGVLKFKTSLRVLGRCEGEITSPGALIIGKGAEVIANIKVGSIIVAGTVKGNIEATQQTEMLQSGKIFGNIRTSQLKMDDGVVFEGKVEMLKNTDSIDIFSASASQLKQSLETLPSN